MKFPQIQKVIGACILALIVFTGSLQQVQAQNHHLEEVVYLKDGSIYRGVIIEQIPNKSLKIQTVGGNVFAVKMEDVEKMTKEPSFNVERPGPPQDRLVSSGNQFRKEARRDSTRRQFQYRRKGYFFQGQLLIEAMQGGIRIINGYKFGRFGYLGVGVGVDAMGPSFLGEEIIGNVPSGLYEGAYLPLFLYHQGDILAKRFTPFYAVEAGWAVPFDGIDGPFSTESGSYREGGFMAGLGVGMKFNTRRRLHFSLLLNVNVKQVTYQEEYYDILSSYIPITRQIIPQAGLRFGIGF